jgi:hypothetical protein
MLPPKKYSYKNKQPQALPTAGYEKKTATGECTVAVNYNACKLTMSRRTTRINNTIRGEESFTKGLDHVHYHQSCASFLRNF